jgi:hypothetical protein
MNRKGVFLFRDYTELLRGDISAALMLSQIVYWYLPSKKTGKSKLRVFRGGRWWLAKRHQEWSDECGFSRMQARRCIEVLKEAHLIECHLFKFAGTPTVHLRLLMVQGQSMVSTPPTACQFQELLVANGCSETVLVSPTTNPLSDNSQSYTESTYREDLQGSCAEDRTRAGEIQTTTGREQEERRDEVGEDDHNRSEDDQYQITIDGADELDDEDCDADLCGGVESGPCVAKPMKANGLLTLLDERTHAKPSLPAYWQSRITAVQSGYQKPLTGKDAGQLKQLHTYLGEQTQEVIDYAIDNWWTFAVRAGAEAGVPWPTSPHIGFLLKHHAVAVNLMRPITKATAAASTEPVYAEVELEVPEHTPRYLTDDELAEMIADLKE